MSISPTIKSYLRKKGIDFDVVQHPRTYTSMQTAAAAHIPGDRVAKTVVLHSDEGYALAVVPSTHRVALNEVQATLHTGYDLASEDEAAELFVDCDCGAWPPLGQAYGVSTVVDSTLVDQPEVFFEAGDHMDLIHVSSRQFKKLMRHAKFARISAHV
ncbi:MAG: YbaK/EbsC family protein [Myxococcota bacterium]